MGNMFLNHLFKQLPDNIRVERRKVKYARIQVMPSGEVQMVVPKSSSSSQVYGFYQEKKDWVERKLYQFSLHKQQAIRLQADELMLFGKAYRVVTNPARKRPRICHVARCIETKQNLFDREKQEAWYRKQARDYLNRRLALLAGQHGFAYNKTSIRGQKTRWGSCSSRKNISLNWKLVKTPVFVSDYVLLHELVHTKIMNHSPAFWQAVAVCSPDYKKAKLWLKQFGAFL